MGWHDKGIDRVRKFKAYQALQCELTRSEELNHSLTCALESALLELSAARRTCDAKDYSIRMLDRAVRHMLEEKSNGASEKYMHVREMSAKGPESNDVSQSVQLTPSTQSF